MKFLLSTASAAALSLSAFAVAQDTTAEEPADTPVTAQTATPQTDTETETANEDASAEKLNKQVAETSDKMKKADREAEYDEKKADKKKVADVQEDVNEDGQPEADPAELAQVEEETEQALDVLARLNEDYMSANDFLGAPVIGAMGDRIARIDDLVIGDDNEIETAILLSGGFFGLGGDRAAVPFEDLDITYNYDREPRVNVSLTEETIGEVSGFEQEDANNYHLVSELIGASAQLGQSDRDVNITDVIVSRDGQASYAIAADGVFAAMGGDRRAIAFDRVNIAQGDGGVSLDLEPATYDSMTLFTYRPGNADDQKAEAKMKKDEKHDKHMSDEKRDEDR